MVTTCLYLEFISRYTI